MINSATQSRLEITVNGTYYALDFPALQPGKSPRRSAGVPAMLIEGTIQMEIVNCTGEIDLVYDNQRDYGRSALDGNILSGEWVARFGRMR